MRDEGWGPGAGEWPNYDVLKLFRLAARLSVYGLKVRVIEERYPPALAIGAGGEVVTVSGGYFVGTFGEVFSVDAAVSALLCPGAEPEPASSGVRGVKWGWLSLGVPYYDSGGSWVDSGWYRPGRAAEITGVSTAALRRWADAGLLSQIGGRGRHRRYCGAELVFLGELGTGQRVTARALKVCAEAMLYGFLRADGSGRIAWTRD